MGRDTFKQTRLLKAPTSLAFNSCRNAAFTASLGNLFQCLTALVIKNFFLMYNLNLHSFNLKWLPLGQSLQALMKNASVSFL